MYRCFLRTVRVRQQVAQLARSRTGAYMSHQEDATPASVPTADVKYKGVVLRDNGTYRVHLKDVGKDFHLGMYASAEEAARVYDREATRRFGAIAVLNFSPEGSLNPLRFTRRRSSKTTSMYKGVTYDPRMKKYKAYVCHGGRLANLGYFITEKEAALAYDRFVKENVPSRPLNFLSDGSLNPYRHVALRGFRHEQVGREAEAPQVQRGDEDTDQAEEKGQERAEDDEEEDIEEEGEQEQLEEGAEAGGRRKRRRLDDHSFIDLTGDGPMQVIAPSASSAAVLAASNRRRTRAAVGGGGSDGPIQPLRLPAQPMPPPAPPTRVQVEAASAVPLPAPLPPIAKVEAPVSQPRVQGGLKMELAEAVSILGQEAFKRLAACERGSEQMESFERLLELLPQLHREARGVNALSSSSSSSPSSASPVSSIVDLRAFLLTSVCPRYTADELKTNQPRLDDIMQMGICLVRLS